MQETRQLRVEAVGNGLRILIGGLSVIAGAAAGGFTLTAGVSVFLCSGWLGPAVRQAVVLPARSGKSVSVQDRKLIHRHFPVVCRMTPVGGDVAQPKPYQFCRGLIGREVSSSFDDLA